MRKCPTGGSQGGISPTEAPYLDDSNLCQLDTQNYPVQVVIIMKWL